MTKNAPYGIDLGPHLCKKYSHLFYKNIAIKVLPLKINLKMGRNATCITDKATGANFIKSNA